MKPTLFMIFVTAFGTLGAFADPFYGAAVYYLFAVLRPQSIWQWALPDMRWSFIVALATLIAATFRGLGPRDSKSIPFTAPHKWMVMFAIWVTVSYVMAQNRTVAGNWIDEYWKIFLMFLVTSRLVGSLKQVWVLVVIAAGTLGYIAYEVNYLYMFSHNMGIYHNGYSGLDNNGAGLMLAIGVPLCLYVFMATARWWRWIFASLIPVLLHAVLMTYSRGAMVSLLAAAPLMFLRGRHRLQLLLAAGVMAAVIPVLAGQEIRARFFTLQDYQNEGSTRQRFASWNAAYRMSLDYPVFGVGIRNSNLFSFQYGADEQGRTIHSQFLQTLADTGYPGLFFYFGILVSTVLGLRPIRKWSRRRDDPQARRIYAMVCAVEGGLAVFVIGSLFLSLEVFELPYVLLLIGAQLPIAVRAEGLMSEAPSPKPASVAAASAWRAPGLAMAGPRAEKNGK